MITIENSDLSVRIDEKGACLRGITDKKKGEELMFAGNPEYWDYSDHVMFPFSCRLEGGWYTYNGKKYESDIHGFAKDMVFTHSKKIASSVTLSLKSNTATRNIYPFDFKLNVTYSLKKYSCGSALNICYEVVNTGDETMYFAIGSHPSFVVDEITDRLFVAPGEYQGHNLKGNFILPADDVGKFYEITPDKCFFKKYNTLILKRNSPFVTLSRKDYLITVKSDSPLIAFWADDERDSYVCIESWWGAPDYADDPLREIAEKAYENVLTAGHEKKFYCEINIARTED